MTRAEEIAQAQADVKAGRVERVWRPGDWAVEMVKGVVVTRNNNPAGALQAFAARETK